jgi:hypothetical protein
MSHSKKFVLTPYMSEPPQLPMATDENVQFSSRPARRPQRHNHPIKEKEEKLATILALTALVGGYGPDLRIKDESGNPIYNSNVLKLVNNALSMSDILIGYDRFVNILFQANVNPEWIKNENLKERLMGLYERRTVPKTINPPPSPPPAPPQVPFYEFPFVPETKPEKTKVTEPVITYRNPKRPHEPDLEDEDADDEWDERVRPPNKKRWIYPDDPENRPLPDDDDE